MLTAVAPIHESPLLTGTQAHSKASHGVSHEGLIHLLRGHCQGPQGFSLKSPPSVWVVPGCTSY